MKNTLVIIATLFAAVTTLGTPGDIKVINKDLLGSSKVCSIAYGSTIYTDFHILCGGKTAVTIEGSGQGTNHEKYADNAQRIFSQLVGILYEANFAVMQTPNVRVRPFATDTLYIKN